MPATPAPKGSAAPPPPTGLASAPTQKVPVIAPVPAVWGRERPVGKSKFTRRRKVAAGSVALVVALAVVANLGGQRSPQDGLAAANPSSTLSSPVQGTTAPTLDPTHEPTPASTPDPTPEPTPESTPKPKPVTYAKLSDRSWAKVTKSPDKYLGKTYVLWACITQFDAATGTDSFRADASNKRREYWYEGVNTMFTGTAAQLEDVVTDDIVLMNVKSLGSFSYDTQIGGNTTVPHFEVEKITRAKGSCAL